MAFDFQNNIDVSSGITDNIQLSALIHVLGELTKKYGIQVDNDTVQLADGEFNGRQLINIPYAKLISMLLTEFNKKFPDFQHHSHVLSLISKIAPFDMESYVNGIYVNSDNSTQILMGNQLASNSVYGQNKPKDKFDLNVNFIDWNSLESDSEIDDCCNMSPGVYKTVKCKEPFHNYPVFVENDRPVIEEFYIRPDVLLTYIALHSIFIQTLCKSPETYKMCPTLMCGGGRLNLHVLIQCNCDIALLKEAIANWLSTPAFVHAGNNLCLCDVAIILIKGVLKHLVQMGSKGEKIYNKHFEFLNNWNADGYIVKPEHNANVFLKELLTVINDIH